MSTLGNKSLYFYYYYYYKYLCLSLGVLSAGVFSVNRQLF